MHHVAHTWRRRGTDMEATWAEAWMAQMCLGADRTAKVEGAGSAAGPSTRWHGGDTTGPKATGGGAGCDIAHGRQGEWRGGAHQAAPIRGDSKKGSAAEPGGS